MTDAPKRIYADQDIPYEWGDMETWLPEWGTGPYHVEYIRADLAPGWSDDMDAAPKKG